MTRAEEVCVRRETVGRTFTPKNVKGHSREGEGRRRGGKAMRRYGVGDRLQSSSSIFPARRGWHLTWNLSHCDGDWDPGLTRRCG